MKHARRLSIGLLVGALHAFVLLWAARSLGYTIGLGAYSVLGVSWRYGGLALLGAVPVWLALRYRLLGPLVACGVTTWYVLWQEFVGPGPIFRDVAELERLAEPTGIIVVEHGLYIVRYMVNAPVWLLAFLCIGLLEALVRTDTKQLRHTQLPGWLARRPARDQAIRIAAAGGLLHAVVMSWFAYRLGLAISNGPDWVLYTIGFGGMWLLATIPIYLAIHTRLLTPLMVLTGAIILDVHAEFTASVDDPHVLYFGAWFLFLVPILFAAGLEYGLRRLQLERDVS